jgi:hypothetical protein
MSVAPLPAAQNRRTLQQVPQLSRQRDFREFLPTILTSSTYTLHTGTEEAVTDEFALRHYDSEEEQRSKLAAALEGSDSSADSDSDGSHPGAARGGGRGASHTQRKSVMDRLHLPQIFYCSRTHSQLAQFVAEIKKTDFAAPDPITGIAPIRCVTLGARRNLCIHPAVSRLKSEGSVSEACLEMQKAASRVTTPATSSAGRHLCVCCRDPAIL